MVQNDREILRLYETRDERALMETTAKYETYCRTVGYTLLGEEAAAKECFREALHKSWKTIPPKKPENLKTYMGKLARAAALEYRLEEPTVANAKEIDNIVLELEECVEPGLSGAENRDEEDGLSEVVDSFLASLPASRRKLFVQRYWYGRSIGSIGTLYQTSPDEVATVLSEMRAELGQAFREAKAIWPLDGKKLLMERIGEIRDAFILEAGGEKTVSDRVPKGESSADRFEDEDETEKRRKLVFPKSKKQIAWITAGVLGAAALISGIWWIVNRQVPIDEKHFPDDTFRYYVSMVIDLDGNGKLSREERSEVYKISITGTQFSSTQYSDFIWYNSDYTLGKLLSLKGIGYFPNLEYLDISGNQLTDLDVSANKALETLNCSGNQLTSLNVSANKALEYLDCSQNQLTQLDVRSNKVLGELNCRNNQLEELKFRSNEALVTLLCQGNRLEKLDVSSMKSLKTLYCFNNSLDELDLSKNSLLETISCAGNDLLHLDFSKNPALKWLDCSDNGTNELNVQKNALLEVLGCNNNQMQELDLSSNPVLTSLSVENNDLTSLNVKECLSLKHLYYGGNERMQLDITADVFENVVSGSV